MIHKKQYPVDKNRPLIPFLARAMEDVAIEHAAILDLSLERLLSQGIAWVLAKMQISVEKDIMQQLPSPAVGGETTNMVTVHTWPVAVSKLQFRRDFEAYAESGECVAKAITQWVIVNMATRRVEKIPDFVAALHPHNPKYALTESKWRIEAQADAPELADFFVTPRDIDINNHVNNVRYVEWIFDSVPIAFRAPSSFEILYRTEAVEGDAITARGAAGGEKEFKISLFRDSDKAELVRARMI